MKKAPSLKTLITANGKSLAAFGCFLVLLVLQSLYLSSKIPDSSYTELGLWCLFAYCCIAFAITMFAWHSKRLGLDCLFLLCLLSTGILYILLLGPIKAPDEYTHYLISYWYSNHILGNFQDGLQMRAEDIDFISRWVSEYGKYDSQYSMLATSSFLAQDAQLSLYRDQYTVSPFVYTPQTYLASSLGLTLGRLLGLSGIVSYYIGRVFQFAAYTACAFIAVKNTPIGKPVFALLPLFPLVIEQATSFSYDGPIIGIASILTAFCFKAIYEKGFQRKSTLIVIAVFSFLLVPCKVVYSVISLLVVAIPARTFSGKKASYGYKAFVLGGCLVVFLVTRLASVASIVVDDTTGAGGETWKGYSINDLLLNPAIIAQLPLNTFFAQLQNYVMEYCNAALGALNVVPENATAFGIAFMIILLLAFMKKDPSHKPTKLLIILCASGFIASSSAITASMIFGWTHFGSMQIEGIQGRYFYPLTFLLVPLFSNKYLSCNALTDETMLVGCFAISLLYSTSVYSFIALSA